jgi:hypothetical protein
MPRDIVCQEILDDSHVTCAERVVKIADHNLVRVTHAALLRPTAVQTPSAPIERVRAARLIALRVCVTTSPRWYGSYDCRPIRALQV